MSPALQPPLQQFELAELFRIINPGHIYCGDPPEKWTRPILLAQLRVRLTEIRGGTREEAGNAIRERDIQLGVPIRACLLALRRAYLTPLDGPPPGL